MSSSNSNSNSIFNPSQQFEENNDNGSVFSASYGLHELHVQHGEDEEDQYFETNDMESINSNRSLKSTFGSLKKKFFKFFTKGTTDVIFSKLFF